MTILVIDDDPDLLSITSKRLQKKGFATLEATNLSQANAHFATQSHKIIAVLSDLFLDQENGIQFFENIQPQLDSRPFVVLTGDEDGDPRIRRYKTEFTNFYCLQKPYSQESLFQILEKALQSRGVA